MPKAKPAAARASAPEASAPGGLPERFRRIYALLYTHAEVSRAERLLEELALILLTGLAVDGPEGARAMAAFLAGEGTALTLLWPRVVAASPGLVDPGRPYGLSDGLLRAVFAELSGLSLREAPAHLLSEAFQALMGPRLRGDRGQFFTPRSVVDAMVGVLDPKPGERMIDPACGTGGFVAAVAAAQRAAGGPALAFGVEKDGDLARLAAAMLQASGGPGAQIHSFNALDAAAHAEVFGAPEGGFDLVLANPPFGAKIPVREPALLAEYALGHVWLAGADPGAWTDTGAPRPSQAPQLLFLERCVRLLRPGGRLGIILPEGVFGNSCEGYVWAWLRGQGEITALLDLPRTAFQPGTDVKTNVLFFQRSMEAGPPPGPPRPVSVAVSLRCGHDKRGRSVTPEGVALPNDLRELPADLRAPCPLRWTAVDALSAHYRVPRYYLRDQALSPAEAELVAGAPTATLGALLADGALTIRKGHEPGSEAYGTGDVPFVRTSDIANFEIRADPTKSVSEEHYRRYAKRQKLKAGDLLLVVDGRYRIGSAALLTENNVRCVIQSHLRCIGVLDTARLSSVGLLLALSLPTVRLRMRSLVFVQSTLGTLGERLLELRLPLLHGPGPWAARLADFERLLRGRDALLAELRGLDAEAPEL